MSVPEQLTIEGEEDYGVTWHEWFLSLPVDLDDQQDDAQETQGWLEEAA